MQKDFYMLRALNKSIGVIFAFFLYPIRSLFLNAFLMLLVILSVFILSSLISTLSAWYAYRDASVNKLMQALNRGMLTTLLMVSIVPPVLAITLATLFVISIIDVFHSMWLGVKEGYREGLFFHVLHEFLIGDWAKFSSLFMFSSRLIQIASNENTDLNEPPVVIANESINKFTDEFTHEFIEPKESPAQQQTWTLLDAQEISEAQKTPSLRAILEQYTSLLERLKPLQTAIEKRDSGNENEEHPLDESLICDEVMLLPIKRPLLLVRQYEKNELWVTAPATTIIMGEEHLLEWMKAHKKHPKFNIPFRAPGYYENSNKEQYPSRFRIFPYVGMSSASELRESAAAIRKTLDEVKQQNHSSLSTSTIMNITTTNNVVTGTTVPSAIASSTTTAFKTLSPPAPDNTPLSAVLAINLHQMFFGPSEQQTPSNTSTLNTAPSPL
jgi:hypothetical protein